MAPVPLGSPVPSGHGLAEEYLQNFLAGMVLEMPDPVEATTLLAILVHCEDGGDTIQ